MLRLLRDPSARGQMQADLAAVIGKLGSPGAGPRAAEAVAELLESPKS
jgi:hypothetical protein